MGRASVARASDKKGIRTIQSAGFTSVISQGINIPRTIAGDTIICMISTTGTPTVTGSSTGGVWQTFRGGNAAPYVWIVVGIPTKGTTSFTITFSATQTISTVTAVMNGVDASILSSVPWGWSSSTGTASPSFTPNVGDVVVAAFSQFSGTSVTATNSLSQQVQNRGLNNTNSRPVAFFSYVNRNASSQTVTPTWNNSQTGGGLIVAFPHL